MLIPLTSFIIGSLIISYSFLGYKNSSIVQFIPLSINLKNNHSLTFGLGLIGLGLMLGLVGYSGIINGDTLRVLRILSVVLGMSLVINQFTKIPLTSLFSLKNILRFLGVLLLTFLFIKCLIHVDWNGDTWMYQLPFSARIWNLVTTDQYIMDSDREVLYNSFPKLANILQGFFWTLGGIRNPQFTNLASYFCFVLYIIFLQFYLKIPFYISTLALLAIPLVHIAATFSYVDLIGNVGMAIVVLMTYLLYIKPDFLNWRNIIIFSLAGGLAGNTKFLLVPPLAVFFSLALLKIVITATKNKSINPQKILQFITVSFLSAITIFTTELINVIRYQNPFYPLKISVLGHVLNHSVVPSENYMSEKLQAMHPIQLWIYSLLEIGAFDDGRPLPWTIAMDFVPLESDTFGLGGYFAVYVIFNVVLFLFLCRHLTLNHKVALILMIGLSLLTAMLPFSYQLRYYMYWIMVLVALNLFLIQQETPVYRWLSLTNFGLVATSVIIIFGVMTKWDYTYPDSNSFNQHLKNWLDPTVLSQLKSGNDYCLVAMSPKTFLYSSPFHDQGDYSVKAEFMISPEYVKEQCANRIIIPHESVKDQLKSLN